MRIKTYVRVITSLCLISAALPDGARAEIFHSIYARGSAGITHGGLYFGEDKSENMLFNPAAATDITKKAASSGFGFFDDNIRTSFLSYSQPSARGALTARFNYLSDSSQETGAYLFSTAFGFGMPVYSAFGRSGNAGVSLRILGKKQGGDGSFVFASDAGIVHQFSDTMKVGAAVTDIAGSYIIGDKRHKLPSTLRLQISKVLENDITLAGAMEAGTGGTPVFKAGAQYSFDEPVTVRAGYRYDTSGKSRLSLGISREQKGFVLNYGMELAQQSKPSHLFSADLPFGKRYSYSSYQLTDTEHLYLRGTELYLEGNLIRAMDFFRDVAARNADHRKTREYMSEINRTLAMLRQRQPREDDFREVADLQDRADAFFAAENYTAALQYYAAILMLDKNNKHADDRVRIINRIIQSREEKEQELAEQRRREAVLQNLENHYTNGVSLHNRGNYTGAINAFNQGIRYARANSMDTWVIRFNSAIKEARDMIAESHFVEGHRHYQRNMFHEALSEYQKALTYNPGNEAAKRMVAEIKLRIQQVNVREAENLYNEGLEAYNMEDYSRAEELWKKTLELNPNLIEAERALERLKAIRQ